MFLKSLTLKGFKSFAESTTLDFEPGITVVVGPNGSGKSNVVDAVAWVLGAQGAKTIRSNKMEDVIFAGTATKAALGRAEVHLTIDNSSRTLPLDFSEITISRVYFRSGESEYAINGVPARLLDLQELLSDTGVGRQQHVIVSQGQLAAILDSRPQERRQVIEEAAGILKFRKRRERSQKRLESTEANFVRLGDLSREVKRQLRPLEKQAQALAKHQTLTNELRHLRMFLCRRDLVNLSSRSKAHAVQYAELERKQNELRTKLASLDAQVLFSESQLFATSESSDANDPFHGKDLGEVLQRTEVAYQKARGQLAFLGERRRSLERDKSSLVDQGIVESLANEATQIGVELDEIEHTANLLPPEFEELISRESELAEERDEFLGQWGNDTADTRLQDRTSAQVKSELGAARIAIDRARADINRAKARGDSNSAKRTRLETELLGLAGLVSEIELSVDSDAIATHKANLAGELATTSAAYDESQLIVSELSHQLSVIDGQVSTWLGRIETLESALASARASAGVQNLAGIEGVIGTVLDLIDIDAGYESAFEAALGETIAAVLVKDNESAKQALSQLRAKSIGCSVLALNTLTRPQNQISAPNGSVAITNFFRSKSQPALSLLQGLLANCVVVSGDWSQALDLAVANPELVVLTTDGDRFSTHAWRAGQGAIGATGASLEKAQAELLVTKENADKIRESLNQERIASKKALDEKSKAAIEVSKYSSQISALGSKLESTQSTHKRSHSDLNELASEDENLSAQIADLELRLTADEERVAKLDEELPILVEIEREWYERSMARRQASSRIDQKVGALSALRRDLEVRAMAIEERRKVLTERSDAIDERLSRSVAERVKAQARLELLEKQGVRVEMLHAVVLDRAERLEQGLEVVRDKRRAQNEAVKLLGSTLELTRKSRTLCETELGETMARTQKLEIDGTELRLRTETLVESVRREFELEPMSLIDKVVEVSDGIVPIERVREIERELRIGGPINSLALDEYQGLKDRDQLISTELDDVKSTRRELSKVITAIDDEIVSIFNAAFADVSANFERLFQTLFPGGAGSLELTEGDDPLNCGVEVKARPSGKKVAKLSLLSGGERSLTALAFLFAVFRSRPSPFYLLDEVEAALDDLNLDRFLNLLNEFRGEAQLLVVSHQRRTMEAADALYGVSVAPGGSSKVVSERITKSVR